ncbi:hypothetical protein ACH5BF_02145 [Arcobacter sp. YIC-464]|uniref:hypothetical protein n=1 Tax=Arcobacter sp. YIC-464 TaxID=3376631 RepID=UPI003C287BDF
MKAIFKGGKAKVGALIAAGLLTASQAQAALLPVDASIDMTEFMAIAGVIATGYLVIKGVQKALQLLRSA